MQNILKRANKSNSVTVFSYNVSDPKRYGILKLNKKNKPIKIVEKPKFPNSNKAVAGLYFYNKDVIDIAKENLNLQIEVIYKLNINKLY